jgi:hypothetical protein
VIKGIYMGPHCEPLGSTKIQYSKGKIEPGCIENMRGAPNKEYSHMYKNYHNIVTRYKLLMTENFNRDKEIILINIIGISRHIR